MVQHDIGDVSSEICDRKALLKFKRKIIPHNYKTCMLYEIECYTVKKQQKISLVSQG